jgi:hypothetical protein
MMQISIVRLGHPQFDIHRVINVINNNQSIYNAKYITQIPNLGKSDLASYSYSDKLLFDKLSHYIKESSITIGITSVQLEDDWWIRPNSDRSAMIITIYQADSVFEKAYRSIEDFVVFKIVTCILSAEFYIRSGQSPYDILIHDDCRGCLFDFCPVKEDRALGLSALKINNQCRGTLLNGNVPEENIVSIESIMKYMKKPSLGKSIYSVQLSAYLSGLFGIGIGIMINTMTGVLIKVDRYYISFLLILLFTVGTIAGKYLYDIFKSLK